jgi:pimeloyl-ACP methyl ester carboxylesterase
MNRRQVWRRIRRVWITLGLSVAVVFIGWSLIAYRASGAARIAIQRDAAVAVEHVDGVWFFIPTSPPAPDRAALVFFPGALVDPIAYAPLLRAAAMAGFPAYLVELPRRGAFGGADDPALAQRFDRVLNSPNTPRTWVIAGHSRGAVVASTLASQHRSGFAGLVVIGSSHPRDVDLSALRVAVTKVVGTRDGLASPEEVEANRGKLPAHTRWVWIDGGNHSQFGWYGFQPGDHRATIGANVQRALMTDAVLDVLRNAAAGGPAS